MESSLRSVVCMHIMNKFAMYQIFSFDLLMRGMKLCNNNNTNNNNDNNNNSVTCRTLVVYGILSSNDYHHISKPLISTLTSTVNWKA